MRDSSKDFNHIRQESECTQSQMLQTNPRKIGLASVYIDPKKFAEQDEQTPRESQNQFTFQNGTLSRNQLKKKSSKKILEEEKGQNLKIKITFIQLEFFPLYILEIVIWVGFFVGSFSLPTLMFEFDLVVNIVCLLKIISVHTYMGVYNFKKKQTLDKLNSKYLQNNEINNNVVELYKNKIELYELFQIESITIVLISLAFLEHQLIMQILLSIKAVRLLFPIFMKFKIQSHMPHPKILWHIIKIVMWNGVIILALSMVLGLFYRDNINYMCFDSTSQLIDHYNKEFKGFKRTNYEICGIRLQCAQGQECLNVYQFAQTQFDFEIISKALYGKQGNLVSYESHILGAFLMTSNAGSIFDKYSQISPLPILIIIILTLWAIGICWGAIGVGEALRCQTLTDWMKKQKFTEPEILNNNYRSSNRKNSNISFNMEKYLKKDHFEFEQSQNQTESNELQLSKQFNRIRGELYSRNILQKIATIFFNILCLSYVALVILDDLEISQQSDLKINIALVSYFIIWTFWLLLSLYEHTCEQKDESASQNRKYIIYYEVIAYSITLGDYILRIISKQFIFEVESVLTPFSHAAISLRIVFVLYNNGIDPQISCYFEKILRNIWSNFRMMGFIIIVGLIAGFIQGYGRGIERNQLQKISEVNNWALMSASQGGNMNGNWDGQLLFGIFKFLSAIFGLYIAKNVNLGYDSIFDVSFSQEDDDTQEQKISQKQALSQLSLCCLKYQNPLRKFALIIHRSNYYRYLKCIIIVSYGALSCIKLDDESQMQNIRVALFVFDIWLIIDILSQVIAFRFFGQHSYTHKYMVIKILYILSQVYLFIIFFIPDEEIHVYTGFIRLTRLLILTQNLSFLQQAIDELVEIFFKCKIKYYKIVISSVLLLGIGMALTARYTSQSDISMADKCANMIGFAINFVYNGSFNFQVGQDLNKVVGILAMSLISLGFFVFYYIILVFMNVTYFVINKNKKFNQESDLVMKNFMSSSPKDYNYELNVQQNLYGYIKAIKVIIIIISTIAICILVGGYNRKWGKQAKIAIGAVNLFFAFTEIFIYFYEHLFVKVPKCKWSKVQALLIVISLPGTFLIMIPSLNFSGSIEVRFFIQIFSCLSILRLLRIIPILINRQCITFSLWRRVKQTIPYTEFGSLLIIYIILMMPFGVSHSIYSKGNVVSSIISFILGPGFSSNPQDTPIVIDLVIKLIASIISLPVKSLCLAKIISSFLTNSPTWLTVRCNKIKQVVFNSKIFSDDRSEPYIKSNEFYRISNQLLKIFNCEYIEEIDFQESIKRYEKYSYEDILRIFKEINIQVYQVTQKKQEKDQNNSVKQQKDSNFAIMLYDLIYYLYLYSVRGLPKDCRQIKTLSNKKDSHIIKKTTIGAYQYSCLLALKPKLASKVAQIKQSTQQNKEKAKKSSLK